ncbi:MAG: alkaline phosphatase family protein [Candidatus Lernaella stagnicola]|nr:alkaline phosphatase family protein [Candidatus Lernaella stagnicola]
MPRKRNAIFWLLVLCAALILFGLSACQSNDENDDEFDDGDAIGDDDDNDDDNNNDDNDDNNDDNDDDDNDNDDNDNDNDDDDTTPYWAVGEDLGPLDMNEYRPLGDQGLNSYEWETGLAAKDALLQSTSVKWVAAYDPAADLYTVWHADGELSFSRTIGAKGPEITVENQIGPDPFPYTDPMTGAGYDAELALLENPEGIQLPEHGYDPDDPRVGWMPDDLAVYPNALERIAQIFDSPHGPDIAFDVHASHAGGGGTHGNLGLMQARSTLLLAGAGVNPGVLVDNYARQVDIAPTVLALLGADTTTGVDERGHRVTNNFLTWQDGQALAEVMTDPSVQGLADYAVIFLFDGLAPNELYYHYENQGGGGLDLPNFFELIENGSFYKGGALVGWPSMSLPGHTSLGTGTYQGHHGMLNNDVYRPDLDEFFSFGWFTDRLDEILHDPQIAVDFYLLFFEDERGVESLYDAVHRSFGDWDLLRPGAWQQSAYTSCVNELTFLGADYGFYPLMQVVSLLLPDARAFDEEIYYLADFSVPWQIKATLVDPTHDVPKLTYASFYITDKHGEQYGPHSAAVRDDLFLLDDKIGQVMDAYRNAGVYDRTVFIVTSDHGMELVKPGSVDPWKPYLDATGIKYRTLLGSRQVYLHVMRVAAAWPTATTLALTVTSDNTGEVVADAAVTVTGGSCQPCEAITDEFGEASVDFAEAPTGAVLVEVVHDDYTPAVVDVLPAR